MNSVSRFPSLAPPPNVSDRVAGRLAAVVDRDRALVRVGRGVDRIDDVPK